MKWTCYIAFVPAFLSVLSHAQTEVPTLKTESVSAVVWDENSPSDPAREVTDPVTGSPIRRLNHAGVEVSLMAAFTIVRAGQAGEILMFTATVANNTEFDIVYTQAGVTIDGHATLPLSPLIGGPRDHNKGDHTAASLERTRCLSTDSPPPRVSARPSVVSTPVKIMAKRSRAFAFVVRDPRNYSLLCASKGCYPKGVMRFYITLNSTDYVFAWRGEALTNCGD